MVNGSSVTTNSSELNTAATNYKGKLNGLASSWVGVSHDSLLKQTEIVDSEIQQVVSQMNSFGQACDDYISYESKKKEKDNEQRLYDEAMAANDASAAQKHADRISVLNGEITALSQSITTHLSDANKTKLSATTMAATESTPISDQSLAPGEAGEFVPVDAKGLYGYVVSSIDGKRHYVYRQSQISGWGQCCNRAAAASIASGFASYDGQAVDLAHEAKDGLGYKQEVTNNYFSQFGLSATVNEVNGSYNKIKADLVNNLQNGNMVMFDLDKPGVRGQSGQLWSGTRHWLAVLDIKRTGNGPDDYAIFVSDSGHGGSTKDYGYGTGWYSINEFDGKKIAKFTTISNTARKV